MGDGFKALIAVTCMAVLATIGWYFYQERQDYLAGKRAAEVKAMADAMTLELRAKALATENERRRLATLTPKKCVDMATATIPEKAGQPPKTQEFIAALKQCDDLNRLPAYERHQLDLMGVF